MATSRINFGEWLPDQPAVVDSLKDATNVIPLAVGYGSFPTSVNYSNAASESLNKVFAGKYGTSTTQVFAGGATKLFQFNGATLALNDVSKTGGYVTPSDSIWSIVQFGNTVLAANNANKIQSWVMGTSTQFNDVSVNAPVAKYITIVRDFVVAGYLDNGVNATKLQWSDLNDETNWVSGSTSQSDFQILADGNNINGMIGGEFGLIFMDTSVIRMSYVGSPLFFQFDTISRNLGCLAGGSVTKFGKTSYFLSDNGFYSCDGTQVTSIGNEKIDRYFFANVDLNKIDTITSAVDPVRKLVVWNYPNISGTRSMMIYNWQVNKWTKVNTTCQYISTISTASITLEGLDAYGTIDSISTSLDSRLWAGGVFLFGGTTGNYISTFTGAASTANITTSDIEQGYNSVVTLVRPQIDNGSCNVSIASRKNLNSTITFSTPISTDSNGRVPLRSSGRYHRFNITPTGLWTTAIGLDVNVADQGTR